jgi:hypothetical protein
MSECLPDVTLDPVAGHGATHFLAYCNPKARLWHIVTLPGNKKTFDNKFIGRTEKPDKISALPQPC